MVPTPGVSPDALCQIVSDRILQLILLPTEKCNFRCTYCYEDFVAGRMLPAVVRGIKSLLQRRVRELDALSLSWFGGEPLLAKDIVLDISTFAAELAVLHPQLSYRGDITTNGYLLEPSTFASLTKVGIRNYQITLDGPRELHNTSRLSADGKGTFDQIWANLLAIRATKADVRIVLRLHLTPVDFLSLNPLLTAIRHDFLSDARFSVNFQPIIALGGPHDASIKHFMPGEREAVVGQLKRELYGHEPIDLEAPPYICYASKANSLLIRANGAIGKCTVALYDSRNTIGTLNDDGDVRIDSSRLRPWLRGIESLDLEELRCPMKGFCG